jgi:hypothetical protein
MDYYTNPEGDTMVVGSIITAYRPGYHVVTGIKDRSKDPHYPGASPLISCKPLLTSKGTKAANSPQDCDASYCRLAARVIPEHIKELEKHIAALKKFQSDYDC